MFGGPDKKERRGEIGKLWGTVPIVFRHTCLAKESGPGRMGVVAEQGTRRGECGGGWKIEPGLLGEEEEDAEEGV